MEKLFNDIKRVSDKEVLYQVSKNEKLAQHFIAKMESKQFTTFEEFLESLPTVRRNFARAVVEAYKIFEYSRNKSEAIRGAQDAYNLLSTEMADLEHEEFWIIKMNNANKVLGIEKLFVGGLTATYVDIRMVLKALILSNATACIVAHNHPSGNIRPSTDDIKLTQSLKAAAKTMNIHLMDHIIVTPKQYYSFCEEGIL